MIKAVLMDAGGVLIAPATGDFLMGPGYEEILGADFLKERMAEFRAAKSRAIWMVPDVYQIDTDAQEYAMLLPMLRFIFNTELGLDLPPAAIRQLAYNQVFRDDRYIIFPDVRPFLAHWQGKLRLGILSDAPPSTRRIHQNIGIESLMDCATYSCELGVLKPDPRMYQTALDKLGVPAEEVLFVDDLAKNLRGAEAVGMQAIQMRREGLSLFRHVDTWEGAVVRDFDELTALLEKR